MTKGIIRHVIPRELIKWREGDNGDTDSNEIMATP